MHYFHYYCCYCYYYFYSVTTTTATTTTSTLLLLLLLLLLIILLLILILLLIIIILTLLLPIPPPMFIYEIYEGSMNWRLVAPTLVAIDCGIQAYCIYLSTIYLITILIYISILSTLVCHSRLQRPGSPGQLYR